MSTHPHGKVYDDWRRAEAGIKQLVKEIDRDQVSYPIHEYTEARVEKLMAQMRDAQRWRSPQEVTFNV